MRKHRTASIPLVLVLSVTALGCKGNASDAPGPSVGEMGGGAPAPTTATGLPPLAREGLRELSGTPALTPTSLMPEAAPRDGSFGESADISGDRLVVGMPGRASYAGAGEVHVYERRDGAWKAAARLAPEPAPPGGRFGLAVAVDEDVIAAGTAGDVVTGTPGTVYVFERSDDRWTQAAILALPSTGEAPWIGAVDVSGDTIVVGHPDRRLGESPGAGAAVVYQRVDGAWTQAQELMASDAASQAAAGAQARFGNDVAISGDTIVVGARQGRGVGAAVDMAGGAYVFERGPRGWTQTLQLPPAAAAEWTGVGHAVDIDGDTIMVATPGPKGAWVLRREGDGWRDTGAIVIPELGNETMVGTDVAVRGRHAAIGTLRRGAMSPPTTPGTNEIDEHAFDRMRTPAPGAVYLFRLDRDGWTRVARLEHPSPSPGDDFGGALAITDDTLVIGAPRAHVRDDGSDTGDVVVVALRAP